jgi:hypothetical protein
VAVVAVVVLVTRVDSLPKVNAGTNNGATALACSGSESSRRGFGV